MTVCTVPAFEGFGKIPRLLREMVVTEKLDGTNAQIYFPEDDGPMLVGSRNRYITPDDDNFGFARWAYEHEAELRALGPGRHFGEWWGKGIQRGYGLEEKRFSLFNVSRWSTPDNQTVCIEVPCCHVVPVLTRMDYDLDHVQWCVTALRKCGSVAAPGFMNPEGVIIYHTASRTLFKQTLDHDDAPKSQVAA